MKKLVLIDGHAILYRAYHAFPKNLRTRQGELVNAVYGFTRILLKVIEDLQPSHLAVCFDLPEPTFRNEIYVAYQHKRPRMDQELIDQVDRVHQVVAALGMPIFEKSGFEADDVIGTLARQASRKFATRNSQFAIIIVTGDRDIMQLVNQKVRVYTPARGLAGGELFGPVKVKRLLGVKPDQIIDYKALVGDASDNYPGVPGVGPKTAVQLLKKYGNLKTIYQSLDKIKPAVAKKLVNGRESARVSKKLAKIVRDAPVKLKLRACRLDDYNQSEVIELFEKLEFKSLVKQLPGVKKSERQMSLI